MKRLAILNGHKMTAIKINGAWMVGGDYTDGGNVLIAAQTKPLSEHNWSKEKVWSWYALKGNRLVYQDSMTQEEINEQMELAA